MKQSGCYLGVIVQVLRWIARGVFILALLAWVQLAIRAARAPESGAAAQRRTEAFLVMVAAGMLSVPRLKPEPADEETF